MSTPTTAPIAWKRICCPVDFSPESRAALRVAIDLCRRFESSLTLLHVHDDQHPADPEALAAWVEDARRAGVKEARADQLRGDPKVVIAEYAGREHELVVMGTHGRTGRAHSLVGSVAESTVRRSRCPVMVIHAEWSGLAAAEVELASA